MKRTSNDICLLCGIEKSTKKNSHIIPKFILKTFFGKNNEHKLYLWNSSLITQKPEKIQDGFKEDYILCDNCERYFRDLETHFSEYLHKRILQEKYEDNFHFNHLNNIEYADCMNLDNTVAKLLFLSILWRCSISTVKVFNEFHIDDEENLRIILSNHKLKSPDNIQDKYENLNTFYLVVIRSKDFYEQTENLIYAQSNINKNHGIIMNEYIVFYSPVENENMKVFHYFSNRNDDKFRVILANDKLWKGLKQAVIDNLIKSMK